MQDALTFEPDTAAGLAELNARVRADLDMIAHPRMPWLTPRAAPDGTSALDVLVVGGGQSGVAAAFGLKRSRVDNVLVVDKAPRGLEGPWLTYARMETLRSPKDFTGPDLDIPSLTYQSWHTAKYGAASWDALDLISREDWARYLLWVRDVTGVPVRNDVAVTAIEPAADGLIAATLSLADGTTETVHARKVILATGQDGMGEWWMPDDVAALPAHLRAHSADTIDFERLRGKVVAVIGAGASAFDNAATALEHGASDVLLFCRRETPQVIQPYRWLTFKGFLDHLGDLDDAWRWRFMQRVLSLREGFPQQTYDRCARHEAFRLIAGAPCEVRETADDRVEVTIPTGAHSVDFVIAATGIDMDFAGRPELAACAGNIASWADRYTPPEEEADARLGRFPYLNRDFSLAEKEPGRTPWIGNIHVFSIAATMSFGASGSSINAMTTCVPKLVSSVTRGLFEADVETHWAALQAYDVPQAIVGKLER
jgi:cation diffusion facilitator CzcD-associated flavoprotein CzcO